MILSELLSLLSLQSREGLEREVCVMGRERTSPLSSHLDAMVQIDNVIKVKTSERGDPTFNVKSAE